ncbi:MAG: Holliday junction branch migration protein RuvA [Candidatus Levybacteria bacterium]|nr:Holliday junction branch migration protein RuvA [Candidatus Levybacteria bacterium]
MIGSIRGKIILTDGNHILVETGGVGYRVLVSSKVLSKTNSEVSLFTYTHVREDALELFGFSELADLKLFENLLSVSGIGPRTAMSIFSFLTREEVVNAVIKGDTSVFEGIPRLGKKNAQKIIIELKSKLGDTGSLDLSSEESPENSEALQALQSFGFSSKEAREALKNIDSKAETAEEKIKLALKFLGK